MALLLKKGRTETEKLQIARQLHGYMLNAGLNYATYEEPQPAAATSRSPLTTQGRAAQDLRQFNSSLNQVTQQQRQQPQAPATRGVPGLNVTPGAPGQPAPAGGAPASPSARSQFQALFPFDSVSGLAAQQSQQQQPPAPR